ncbi:MAG: M4 family metallopeptidase [Deltaproteobacteria bacterium]|nr:M4 family metallopeptidase [Deltaproteobacteria bacterium]
MYQQFHLPFCFVAALILLLAFSPTSTQAQLDSVESGVQGLVAATGPGTQVRLDSATGTARFVRLEAGSLPALAGAGFPAQAESFFETHGSAFGIENAARELEFENVSATGLLTHVTHQQRYRGLPVFGGELRSHFDKSGNLLVVNGTFVSKIAVDPNPKMDAEEAAKQAVVHVASRTGVDDLESVHEGLTVFRTGLIRGVPGSDHLAYQLEVSDSAKSIRVLVFVDAHSGIILDQISRVHTVLDREISETSLGNVVWVESDPDPIPAGWAGGSSQQVTDWQNEIDASLETYNVFSSMTNGAYLSYDGVSATMRTVNNDPGISCPNANWNGISTNYCSGVTGDDTVAHEWGHAYTEYTNNLIYQWQSGALNESYSDIWGEVVDFINGRGSDAPGGLRDAQGRYCSSLGAGPKRRDSSYRWLSGEDDPAFGGAIRDLWRPECYGDPGRVTSGSYTCSTADSGGVHTNSGVPNHGFALMVDGGSYNGQSITGIGLEKAARLHWEAQNLLTSSSDFVDHADALDAACSALTGATLYQLDAASPNGVVSGQTISSADCAEVSKAIAAVELRTLPTQCNFQPLLQPNAPALCGGGTVNTILLSDFEAGLGLWGVGTRAVVNAATFSTPDWATVASLPAGRTGTAAFVEDNPLYGDCATDVEAGVLFLESPTVSLPAGASTYGVAFDHWVSTELGWDGSNVKVSVNGGSFGLINGSSFDFNAYNGTLNSLADGSDNPMAGEEGFTGGDGGSVSGSWGQSQVDLNGIAGGGDDVQLRFEMGLDGCNGVVGWYVDDVHVHSCSTAPPTGCDNDNVCEPGENCNNCSNDCAGKLNGNPSGRYCCGDGTIQSAETAALCDGNF